jgi:predicted Fe-Mo cluster-binding NifX family protein
MDQGRMKTAITSIGNEKDSKFDLRFGRAGWFCIYDSETGTTEFLENESKGAKGGAGTKAVETIAELGVTQVVSGDFGPKAKELLEQLKIQMIILNEANSSIQEIINTINKH